MHHLCRSRHRVMPIYPQASRRCQQLTKARLSSPRPSHRLRKTGTTRPLNQATTNTSHPEMTLGAMTTTRPSKHVIHTRTPAYHLQRTTPNTQLTLSITILTLFRVTLVTLTTLLSISSPTPRHLRLATTPNQPLHRNMSARPKATCGPSHLSNGTHSHNLKALPNAIREQDRLDRALLPLPAHRTTMTSAVMTIGGRTRLCIWAWRGMGVRETRMLGIAVMGFTGLTMGADMGMLSE